MTFKENPETDNYDEAVHGACYMCDSYCPTKIFIKNGKAIGVEMLDDKTRDLCPRWKAQLDFVYHKERLQHPLRRVGERGSGEFERISWNEALDIIADKLLELKEKLGPESVVWYIAYTKSRDHTSADSYTATAPPITLQKPAAVSPQVGWLRLLISVKSMDICWVTHGRLIQRARP